MDSFGGATRCSSELNPRFTNVEPDLLKDVPFPIKQKPSLTGGFFVRVIRRNNSGSQPHPVRGSLVKKNRVFISVIVLVMASLSCAKSFDNTSANIAASSAPEFRWKYESGG